MRIVHIEDDLLDQEILQEFFRSESGFYYSLRQFNSIESASEAIENERLEFDVCILDLGLKNTTGIETYHRFKKYGYKKPVVILTGLDDEETGEQAIQQGAQDYLIKGKFNSCNLIHSIKFAVSRYKIEQELKLKENQYRCIFESVTDALILLNGDGEILSINSAVESLFGYTIEEFKDKGIGIILGNNYESKKELLMKTIISGDVFKMEIAGKRKTGEDVIYQIASRKLPIEEFDQIVILIHDISDIREKEKELNMHKEHLEELVKEQTKEIEDKYYELAKDYKLMLNREFRIKELRDENMKLKQEISSLS